MKNVLSKGQQEKSHKELSLKGIILNNLNSTY